MEKTKLEEINPARSAQIGLIWYRVVFVLALLVEVGWAIGSTGTLGLLGLIPPLVAILVTVLIYNWVSRTAIAPLMTWHYAKQNAECAQRILEHLRAQSPRPAAYTVKPTHPPHTFRASAKPAPGVSKTAVARPAQPSPAPEPASATVPCPNCGSPITIRPGAKAVGCPSCGKVFDVE